MNTAPAPKFSVRDEIEATLGFDWRPGLVAHIYWRNDQYTYLIEFADDDNRWVKVSEECIQPAKKWKYALNQRVMVKERGRWQPATIELTPRSKADARYNVLFPGRIYPTYLSEDDICLESDLVLLGRDDARWLHANIGFNSISSSENDARWNKIGKEIGAS